MDPQPRHGAAARYLSDRAHGLRNHVATLHAASALIDDEEVASSVRSATTSLRIDLERAVVASRVELEAVPAIVEATALELLEWSGRRAAREGTSAAWAPAVEEAAQAARARVPGSWIERALADLLHACSTSELAVRVDVRDGRPELRIAVAAVQEESPTIAPTLAGCGVERAVEGDELVLRLPTA